jgi:hypothetical protein
VAIYDKVGVARGAVDLGQGAGVLPVIGLKFSEEIDGSGTCTYEALMSDVDALSAWDAVIKIELETTPGTWVPGPAYVSRHQYTHHAGFRRFAFQCRGLLEAWADETVFLPEYVVDTVPKKSGEDRGIGWMSTAYVPAEDTGPGGEPWDGCYDSGRTTMPGNWPSGTGAEWISVTGASDTTERKYFRTTMTISGGTAAKLYRFWLASDENAMLWVAGERVIDLQTTEDKKMDDAMKARRWMFPGKYAVGVSTETVKTKGGDGVDPILVAVEQLDAEGNHIAWVKRSNNTTWVACRRDDEPPLDQPPGPTPGQVLLYLIGEAKDRNCTGWRSVTFSFTKTTDTYGQAWEDVIEELFDYAHHTYKYAFDLYADSDQFDVWMGADLILHAAKKRGQERAITFTEEHFWKFGTQGTEGYGTWGLAKAHDGWVWAGKSSGPRREFGAEFGTAITRPIAKKKIKAALKDSWRWDASGSMNPPQPGWQPYVDISLGDWMHVDYRAVIHNVCIMSFSAEAGEGGLKWDIEFTEYPLPSDA